MTSITVSNVTSPESVIARAIVAALQGQTFMNLQVNFAPIRGSFNVLVETDYPETTEEDLTQLVLRQLCFCLPRA